MLASLDDNVGRVLDKLTALDLDTRTLVVFLGDCGGGGRMNASENAPLRGVRGQMFEGGIRVPFFARWSDFIPAGKSCNQPVTALDLLPTAVAVAGAEVSPDWKLDGASLLPLLTGTGNAPLHQSLCWRCGVESAIRAGDWKLVRLPRSGPKLFNLSEDIAEHTDLSGQEIGTARKLGVALDEWAATLADPLWTNGRQAKAAKSAAEGKRPHAPKKKPAGAGRDESQPVTSVQPSQGI
jgi:arylsulfatase A-like enzyme